MHLLDSVPSSGAQRANFLTASPDLAQTPNAQRHVRARVKLLWKRTVQTNPEIIISGFVLIFLFLQCSRTQQKRSKLVRN